MSTVIMSMNFIICYFRQSWFKINVRHLWAIRHDLCWKFHDESC